MILPLNGEWMVAFDKIDSNECNATNKFNDNKTNDSKMDDNRIVEGRLVEDSKIDRLDSKEYLWNNTISIPSTTEIAKLKSTTELEAPTTMYLGREYKVNGPVWYKKMIEITKEKEGYSVNLHIGRTKFTKVYLDGIFVSESFETVIPQQHSLGVLSVGEHELIVCVDNALENYEIFSSTLHRGHQYTDHTQTNWNGMMGYTRLSFHQGMYIHNVMIMEQQDSGHKISEQQNSKRCIVDIHIEKQSGLSYETLVLDKEYSIDVKWYDQGTNFIYGTKEGICFGKFTYKEMDGYDIVTVTMDLMIQNLSTWDEFAPNWYDVVFSLQKNEETICEEYRTRTGVRRIKTEGRNILLNGKRIHLRGSLDCGIYPATGVCPDTKEEWIQVLSTMKEYGLNHYRFHSWCPPREAFLAADELGMYLQVELSNFANGFYAEGEEGYDKALNDYLYDQSRKVIETYGNHPSLILYVIGNEMVGNINEFAKLLREIRSIRSDILYTQGSNNFLEDPLPCEEDDVWIMMRITKEDNIRASFSHNDPPLGYMQRMDRQGTMVDYNVGASVSKVPVISHEIGQFQSFPRMKDKEDYVGPLRCDAWNIVEERLVSKDLLQYNEDYYYNSGALLVACYKEEIEAALRTNEMSGFQLLGLQDFPGQGTALVGVLDSFLKNKGFITPSNLRQFCNSSVVLGRLPSYSYELGDMIPLEVLVYNYSGSNLVEDASIQIYEGNTNYREDMDFANRKIVYESFVRELVAEDRNLISVINHEITVSKEAFDIAIGSGKEYTLVLTYGENCNTYPLWVYNTKKKVLESKDNVSNTIKVMEGSGYTYYISSVMNEEVKELAKNGKNVLVISSKLENTMEGFFTTDFWCYPMFKEACIMTNKPIAPGTLGLSINTEHKIFEFFPTTEYSNWQWQPITMNSNPVILDCEILEEKREIDVIVRVIDNFDRNHHLGLIYEEKIGTGRIVTVAAEITEDSSDIEIRGLYQAVVRYMESL